MNRRNFFKAAGAAVLGGVVGKATEGEPEPKYHVPDLGPLTELPIRWNASTGPIILQKIGVGHVVTVDEIEAAMMAQQERLQAEAEASYAAFIQAQREELARRRALREAEEVAAEIQIRLVKLFESMEAA